ncbi:MAG: MBL fold metallo-hydrolase [Candidatus Aminicenantes bacterium]|nr:MBL fold metallo-hydrolase [Candidatus Aminicenantes bacterium]
MSRQRPSFHFLGFCLGLTLAVLASPLTGQNKSPIDDEIKGLQASNALFSEGLKEFERGETGKAVAALEECVRKMPRHTFAHYYLANILYIQKDYPRALSQMELSLADYDHMVGLCDRADRLKLDNMDGVLRSLQSVDDMTASCRDARSVDFFGDQITDKGILLQDAAKRRRQAQEWMKGHYVYFYGNILFQLQRFSDARRQYEEALRIDPRHANAYNNLTAVYYLFKMYPMAIEVLDRAEANGIEDFLNLKLKEMVYRAAGRPTEGIFQEDFPPGREGGPAVMRFALAVRGEGSTLPPLYENGYLVFDAGSGQVVLIDPGVADPRIRDFAADRKLEVKAVLNTHGHGDHLGGNRYFADLFKAPICVPKNDSDYYETKPDRSLRDGETFEFGSLRIEVLHTPGHTAGSVCFLVGDCLFSGDTLFKNDIGKVGTDDERKIPKLRKDMIRRIRERLFVLPGETRVFPGHGRTTRIADEKDNNPILK